MSIYQYKDESPLLCTVPMLEFKCLAASLNRIEGELTGAIVHHIPAFTIDVNNVTNGRWFKISVHEERITNVYGALVLFRAHAAHRKEHALCFVLDTAIEDLIKWEEPREELDLILFRFSLITSAQIGLPEPKTRWYKTGIALMAMAFAAGAALSHLLNTVL